jgi:hypothetical protein
MHNTRTPFRWKRGLMLGLLLVASGAYVIAEDITLTTYYPSPRGVYDQLRSMGQTLLAQQTDSVGIGTAVAPLSKLGVDGNASIGSGFVGRAAPADGLIVEGTVGIGESIPLSKFGVSGNASVGGAFAGVAAPANGLIVEGTVGVGTPTPATKLDVEGGVKVGCELACNAGLAGTIRWVDAACTGSLTSELQVCNGSAWERISSSVFTPCTPPGSLQTRTTTNCSCPGGTGFVWSAQETCTCDNFGNWTSCTNTCAADIPVGYVCP